MDAVEKKQEVNINIKDVARRAGVSIATVSHVMRGTKYVSDDLKKRVRHAIDELKYEVNPVASGLKSKKSRTIGVIIPNLNRIFFPQVIKGIQDYLTPPGYHLTFCDTDDSLEKEKFFLQTLRHNWVDGLILGSVADDDDHAYFEALCHLGGRHKHIAVVSLERLLCQHPLDAVYVDNYQGGRIATNHLWECGCRQIAYITGPAYSPMVQNRQKGYESVLNDQKLGRPMVYLGDFSPASGYRCTKRILASRRKVDGIFTGNDQMAVGALKAIKEAGRRVPQDIKVVGFDDTFVASIISPSLTTVHVPKYDMGVKAAELLLKRISDPQRDVVPWELPIHLVVRQTTQAKAQAELELSDW